MENKPITLDVTFVHDASTPIPQLGKQHLTLRHTKTGVGWLFALAELFRIDLGGVDWLHYTIDFGDVECIDVNVSVEDGQTVVTAIYKGGEEGE